MNPRNNKSVPGRSRVEREKGNPFGIVAYDFNRAITTAGDGAEVAIRVEVDDVTHYEVPLTTSTPIPSITAIEP